MRSIFAERTLTHASCIAPISNPIHRLSLLEIETMQIEMEKIEAGRGSICGWRERHERYRLAGSGMFEKLYMSRVRQKNMEFFKAPGVASSYIDIDFSIVSPQKELMMSVTCCRFDSDSPET